MKDKTDVRSPAPKPWDIDFSNDPGLTRQEFKKDCDVNEIIKRCIKSGLPIPGLDVQGAFADVSEYGDFAECLRRVSAAQDAFMSLEPGIRAQFQNDPAKLLAFVSDDANHAKAIELGLIPKPAPEAVKPPEAVQASTPPKI